MFISKADFILKHTFSVNFTFAYPASADVMNM